VPPLQAGARPGEKIVTHISNFRSVKRVDDVVRIFARVAREMPARLLLVGDGPDRAKAHDIAEAEGVADRVLFLGKQNSVAELLSCSDLFLLPSENEAFGLVALEAMACGVPVVATRIGGIPEVVEHGVSGYLADVGDVDAMAEPPSTCLRDPTGGGSSVPPRARRRAIQRRSRRLPVRVVLREVLGR
jgi:L-malate glycosyltransferase